ncbi:hypothetical protein ACHAPC_002969 [Botrytis cinerea]|nr:hypothetical protein BcDW1_5091 [Botrytis cinerea BcDW1]CCD43118.1 hypothetical protein BofuT4_P069580.1 [Botrytis cinerea T4]
MPPSRCAQQRPAQPAQFSLALTASALSSGGVAFIATEGNLSSSVAAPQRGGGRGGEEEEEEEGERGEEGEGGKWSWTTVFCLWGSGALARNCPTPRDGDGGEGGSEGRRGVEWTRAWNRQQTAQREQGTAMIRPEDSISRQPAQSVAGDAGPSGPSQISAQTNVEELGQAFFAAQAIAAQARLEVAEAEAGAAQADLQVRLAKAAAAQAHAEQLEMAVANATPLPPNDEDDLDLDPSARPAQSATGGTEAIGGLGL